MSSATRPSQSRLTLLRPKKPAVLRPGDISNMYSRVGPCSAARLCGCVSAAAGGLGTATAPVGSGCSCCRSHVQAKCPELCAPHQDPHMIHCKVRSGAWCREREREVCYGEKDVLWRGVWCGERCAMERGVQWRCSICSCFRLPGLHPEGDTANQAEWPLQVTTATGQLRATQHKSSRRHHREAPLGRGTGWG